MRVTHRKFVWGLLLFCGTAAAEVLDSQKAPVIFPVGPFEFAPVLEAAESYNDNIFQRNSFKKASFLTQFHAGGELALERKLNRYALTYVLQSSQYHNSPQDDYVDHFVGGTSHFEFTRRNRLDINLGYLDSHYQRGVFLGRDLLEPTQRDEPDQYRLYSADMSYRYGRVDAKGNLGLDFSVQEYAFLNNREFTVRLDRTRFVATPGFYFRMAPKTTLLAQVENEVIKYRASEAAAFDYTKQRFLLGGIWHYSVKTQVSARFGYLRQEFDNAELDSVGDVTWNLSLQWAPLSYSQFDLSTARDANPTLGDGNLRVADRFSAYWAHDWSPRVTSRLFGAYENAENLGIDRQDDFTSFGFDITYGVRRWLGVGISYTYRNLKSSDETIGFAQNSVMFYITGNPRMSDQAKSPWATWY
jgi:hypothetical protein